MSIQGFVIEDFDESLEVPQTAKFLFQYGNKYYKVPLSTLGSDVEAMLTIEGGDFNDGGDTAGANRSLGNNDAYSLTFKTNNTSRLFLSSGGYVGIGTSSPSTSLHVATPASEAVLFAYNGTPSVTIQDQWIYGFNAAGSGKFGLYTQDNGSFRIQHRTPTYAHGAVIQIGNDNASTNANGISIKTGTNSSINAGYALHIQSDGNCTLVTGLLSSFSGTASDFGKLNIKSSGSTSSTMALHIMNSESSSMFKVWDNGRIGINKSATPSAILDLYSSSTGTTAMVTVTSGSGALYSQYANGNVIIGSGISAGIKVAIKGTATAYAFTSTTIPAALHLVGTLRIDEQSSLTAGAFASKYLAINIDGTAYKIQLYANA